jgi:hypothetical protein
MSYENQRHNIKTGDIIAWSEGGFSSFKLLQLLLIRMFTLSEYNHVGVAWVVGDRVMVVDAVVPKIRLRELSTGLPFYHITTDIIPSDEVLLAQIGKPYSKWEAIKAFFHRVTPGDNSVWQCAELVNWILNKADPTWNINSTPTAVVEYAMKRGGRQTYLS